jgi:hypothetical protein
MDAAILEGVLTKLVQMDETSEEIRKIAETFTSFIDDGAAARLNQAFRLIEDAKQLQQEFFQNLKKIPRRPDGEVREPAFVIDYARSSSAS